jgi:hypothetical protein
MIQPNKKTAVVYLAWLPYGISHFKSFVESYLNHPSGWDHELLIVFNGTQLEHPDPASEYVDFFRSKSSTPFETMYFPKGQDIEIYSIISGQIGHDFIFYLNTFSIITCDEWLRKIALCWHDRIGVIGASGSWQSYYSSVFATNSLWKKKGETWMAYYRKIKLFLKAFFIWRNLFDSFPNAHLRTNAFFVAREDFFKITSTITIKNKFDAYLFENGKNGMTRSFEKMGKQVMVINCDGDVFEKQNWHKSKTFRVGNQEKLMVTDNQTREYACASIDVRNKLSWLSWGNHA